MATKRTTNKQSTIEQIESDKLVKFTLVTGDTILGVVIDQDMERDIISLKEPVQFQIDDDDGSVRIDKVQYLSGSNTIFLNGATVMWFDTPSVELIDIYAKAVFEMRKQEVERERAAAERNNEAQKSYH